MNFDDILCRHDHFRKMDDLLQSCVIAGLCSARDYFVSKAGKITHTATRDTYNEPEFRALMGIEF